MTAFGQLRLALNERGIRHYLFSHFLSQCGTWIQRVVVGWLTFEYTGSAAWVGFVAACEIVPTILVSPLGGALFDRSDRAKMLAFGQLLAQLQALALLALTATGMLNITLIVASSFALGLIEGLCQPARLAIVSDMATRPELIRPTISLNSFVNNIARFIGPAAAGIALTTGGPSVGFTLNVLSFFPLMLLLFSRRGRHLPEAIGTTPAGFWTDIGAGFRYGFGHNILGPILLLAALMSFFTRSLIDLLPAVAGFWYAASPEYLAILVASVGGGAAIGAMWMLSRDDLHAVTTSVLTLPAVSVLCVLAFAILGTFLPIAAAVLFILGFCQIASGVGMQSVIHLTVNPAFRGRVLGLYGVIQRALAALGAITVGAAADLIDMHIALAVASVIAGSAWLALRASHRAVQAHIATTHPPQKRS